MSNNLYRLTGLLIALLTANVSIAGMYKWTDAEGQVHYSDNVPADTKPQTLNPDTALPTGVEKEKSVLDKQVEEMDKRREESLKKEEEEKKKAEAEEVRKNNCIKLRKNLQVLLTKNRVRKEVNGEVVVIPYEERVKKIEEAQKKLDEVCKGF